MEGVSHGAGRGVQMGATMLRVADGPWPSAIPNLVRGARVELSLQVVQTVLVFDGALALVQLQHDRSHLGNGLGHGRVIDMGRRRSVHDGLREGQMNQRACKRV